MIPASAATLLKLDDFDVNFIDGIAQRWSYEQFLNHVQKEKPDLMAIETKTPVVKQHWNVINHIKEYLPEIKIALMGDHVTVLPQESLEKSEVDYVITGGDFDVSLLKLANHLRDDDPMPKGLWFRDGKDVRNTGPFELVKNLDNLPFVDRELTKFWLYYENWYKRKPFAYTMGGRDCPWGKCTFCAWTVLFPKFRCRSPDRHLDEIGDLIEKHRVREIFDDTGTFPPGRWLKEFCAGMIERGYNERVLFSCNFRYDYINRDLCRMMKKAGFRLLKVGLESASQKTLDAINKNLKVQQIVDGSKIAKEAGLEIHLTIMVGYPWETRSDALRTLSLAKKLMEDGVADVLQSTIVVPYPGTRLYYQALEQSWFRIDPKDYEHYDMTEPPLKTQDLAPEEIVKICDEIYKIYLSPKYVFRRFLKSLLSREDLALSLRGTRAVIGHIRDYAKLRL
jgi:radical SAM superfamily enzyme YgiQ (UPF0313 family)